MLQSIPSLGYCTHFLSLSFLCYDYVFDSDCDCGYYSDRTLVRSPPNQIQTLPANNHHNPAFPHISNNHPPQPPPPNSPPKYY